MESKHGMIYSGLNYVQIFEVGIQMNACRKNLINTHLRQTVTQNKGRDSTSHMDSKI